MTSGENQDWRGGRAPRNAPRTEKAVPSWKQSSSKSGAPKGPGSGSWKRRLRILFVSGMLLALVIAAIIVMLPARSLRTHFVLLNLRHESVDFDAAAEFQLPPDYNDNTYRRIVTRSVSESLSLSQASDDKSLENLKKSDVVVVYLQTTFIPASNGSFRCLLRNSTPNLNTNEFAELQTLKDEIKETAKSSPTKNWLLLIDQIPTGLEWRTGLLQSDVQKQFESWVDEIPGLMVVLSSATADESESGTPGSEGRSIFSYFASLGLTRLASAGANVDLTTNEFCRFVTENTNSWVRSCRNPNGQSVKIIPADGARNFVFIRDTASKSQMPESNILNQVPDSQLTKRCSNLWELRSALAGKGGLILSPIVWRSATEDLKRAERAILNGLNSHAEKFVVQSEMQFTSLKNELDRLCPNDGDFQAGRGFFRQLNSALPSAGRSKSLTGNSTAVANSDNAAALAEDVLAAHLTPLSAVTGVNASGIEIVHARRKKAEESIAELFNCAYWLQRTVPSFEKTLLLAEDRRFTSTQADAGEEQTIDEMLDAIPAYAEARGMAETTLRRSLDSISELAFWSAHYDGGDSEQDQNSWRDVLSTNFVDTKLKADDIRGLSDKLSVLPTDEATELPELARRLRKEVFQLCAYARGLMSVLETPEPESGFEVSGLREFTEALRAWNDLADRSLKRTITAAETLCNSAAEEKPALRLEQVRIYRVLRSTLNLSCVSAVAHNRVFGRLLEWDRTWSNSSETESAPSTEEPKSDSWQPPADLEALWFLQVLNLMPVSENQASELQRISGLMDGLAGANTEQRPLAEFGDAARKVWIANQQNVSVAAKSTADKLFSQLQEADRQVRLYSGFDAKVELNTSISARMRELAKLHFCILQAGRLVDGLWVNPGEQDLPPLSKNGWFAGGVSLWLEAAEATKSDSGISQKVPPAIDADLESIRERLKASDELKLLGKLPPTNSVDLGDESLDDVQLGLDIAESVPDSVSGIASVLIRLPSENGANQSLSIDGNAVPIKVTKGDVRADLNIRRLGIPDNRESCKPFELQPEVFFRGRSWKTAQSLSVCTCAAREFITEFLPRSETASITVFGDDPRPVILILDFSGSMKDKLADGTPRYEAAIATLESLIHQDRLRDARVTLKVFGHRVQWDPIAKLHRPNPRYVKAFPDRPIPKALDTHNDIENLFEGTLRADDANVKAEFLKVLELLRSVGHWGSTPLFESIRDAIATDLGRNSGIVIAITDGTPTDDGDPIKDEPDRTRDLRLALDSNPDTSVTVVAFDVNKNPAERNRLTATFNKFGGRVSIVDALDANALSERIELSLDPRKFTVTWESETRSREVELGGTAMDLPPGNDFFVRFGNNISMGPLVLNPGDALQLNLLLKQKRFRVSRLPGRSEFRADLKPSGNDHPWILKSIDGVQTSDIPGEDANEFAKSVVRLMLDHEDDARIVRQPAEIEFYIRDQDSPNRPGHLTQRYDSRCGAPAWEFTVDRWRKGKSFMVDAVWKMERSVPERLIDWESLKDADGPGKAILVNDNATGLPSAKAWVTLRGQELQVRIDPVPGEPYSESNQPADIRIELGQPDTQEQARTFLPWELETTVVRTERGSVIFKFSGDKVTADNLKRAKIAFTSSANRRNGATVIRDIRIQY